MTMFPQAIIQLPQENVHFTIKRELTIWLQRKVPTTTTAGVNQFDLEYVGD